MGMGGTRRFLHIGLIAVGCVALLLAGCGGEDASPTETPAATSSPSGIAEVDAIIDAVERQDVEALLGFVKYQRIDCESPTSDGYILPPTCPEGVLQGTAVDAFLAGACHPGWVTPVEVADAIDWVGREITTHAVFRGGEPFAEFEADYRVVLSSPTDLDVEGLSSQLGISGGGVVWLTGWCDSALGQIEYLQEIGAEPIYLAPSATIDTGTEPMATLPDIINGFLVLEGSEFFGAIPPCTSRQAEEIDTAESPLTIGVVPEGTVEVISSVSVCPDGTILSAVKQFDSPDNARHLRVFYARPGDSYPVMLAPPPDPQIEPLEINGRRGLMVLPTDSDETYSEASLRFWVADQVDHTTGAYVAVGLVTDAPDIGAQLIEIAESVTVNDPTNSSP